MNTLDLLSRIEAALPRLRELAQIEGQFFEDNYAGDIHEAAGLLIGVAEAYQDDEGTE